MISATQLRAGRTFVLKGEPFKVLKYTHTHISRGAGTIKVKVRNLRTGRVASKTFRSGAQVEEIEVKRSKLQFLYRDGDQLVFMDPKSFEQVNLPVKVAGEASEFMTGGQEVDVFFWEGKPLEVDLAPKLVFKVAETGPGVKGDTATAAYKPATLENGLVIQVPLFIKKGEQVWVDTRTREYVGRA